MSFTVRLFTVLCLLFVVSGCGGIWSGSRLQDYELASPSGSDKSVFETSDVLVRMDIIADRMYGLSIKNKTATIMRVFWINSTAISPDGRRVRVDALTKDETGYAPADVTVIKPGSEIDAEAFPVENEYKNSDGTAAHYPLYYAGEKGGSASDLKNRNIGMNLVLSINGRTRMFSLPLKVNTSVWGI